MTELQMQLRLWRHVTRGTAYQVMCEAVRESDMSVQVIYRDAAAQIWVRPKSEFLDGRFEWFDRAREEWVKP